MKKINATISGIVQGVGFRYFVHHIANRLNLKGYVKNLYNGDVYVEAEGDETSLNVLIKELWHGPRLSRVNNVDVRWDESKGQWSSFEIDF